MVNLTSYPPVCYIKERKINSKKEPSLFADPKIPSLAVSPAYTCLHILFYTQIIEKRKFYQLIIFCISAHSYLWAYRFLDCNSSTRLSFRYYCRYWCIISGVFMGN